jgi:hypothetical protein
MGINTNENCLRFGRSAIWTSGGRVRVFLISLPDNIHPCRVVAGVKTENCRVGVGKNSFVEVGDDKDCTLPQPHMKFSK